MRWRIPLTPLGLAFGVRALRNLKRAILAWAFVGTTVFVARVRAGTVQLPDFLVRAWLRVADGPVSPTTFTGERELTIDLAAQPSGLVDERFLSVAIDSSQVVGGHWWSPSGAVEPIGQRRVEPIDLRDPRLRRLARELAPAYLRIGGTEADRIYYGVAEEDSREAPAPFDLRLTRSQWEGVADFAKSADLDLFFTLNAGPSSRDAKGRWTTDNAERLLRHARTRGDTIRVLELGNEINGYWFNYGISGQPDGAIVAEDLRKLRALARELMPGALIVGPAEFYWPRVGSPLVSRTNVLSGLLAAGGAGSLDAITWHYYPEQSRRCPIATRRASLTELLDPGSLDEVSRWAGDVEARRDRSAGELPVWLGETGGAQCGGEPGVSDRFASSLWWMDQLGLLASRGHAVVVRQTLLGSNYGLVDDETFAPRPDYFASVLFKRLMGRAVLAVKRVGGGDPFVRVYAHCTPSRARKEAGSVTALAINLHQDREAVMNWPAASGRDFDLYSVTAPSLESSEVDLNGKRMSVSTDEVVLVPETGRFTGALALPPASYAFLVVAAGVDACSD
jgi:heparanase 1